MGSTAFKKALVVGTVRNAQNNVIPDLLRIMEALEATLPTACFVVESDSSDETVKRLSEQAKIDPRFKFISLGNLAPTLPDRIDRLRYCRNEYVKAIRSIYEYQDRDLIIVADLDGINKKISEDSFKAALESEFEWDVLTANQAGPYYDILALRHPLWSPNNWTHELEWRAARIGKTKAIRHSLTDRMIRIPADSAPIAVDSAFGGLGIYRRWIFENFDYSKESQDDDSTNEHVSLSNKAKEAGANIYIHPGLINANWTSHSRNAQTSVLWTRRILSKVRYFGMKRIKRKYFNSSI
jgi:hypothetical protein